MEVNYNLISKKGAWGDQGDGTYVNPVLPGDYSDPDGMGRQEAHKRTSRDGTCHKGRF
ncbi:hypothetical protein [Paenibacillus andongensis]|uniref:hypothetical protein n=1 Tax=Paenibacillus andongensis TaxID=2975482 RepID=UPI0021BBA8DA|nr:hypothetical protein [Paenibacillus andongensis]